MLRRRRVFYCPATGMQWEAESPSGCDQAGHEHAGFEVHVHRDLVTLPDGTVLTAASFDDSDPYRRDRLPDFGLYLDRRWKPPWATDSIDWPDFGVPSDPVELAAALQRLHDRARSGEFVEIGCVGGHGRTGTAIACLLVLTGLPPGDAIDWVRGIYCTGAIETTQQEAFVTSFGDQ